LYGTLAGTVRWPGFNNDTALPLLPAGETTVSLYSGDSFVASTTTSLEGSFVFPNLEPGDYTLKFRRAECLDRSVPATVTVNAVTTVATDNFNCVLPRQERSRKNWTILYYINGTDTAHARAARSTLRLLEKIGSTESLNIVAMVFDALGSDIKYYYLKKPAFAVDPDPIDEAVGDPEVFSPYYSFNCWDAVRDPGADSVLENSVLASMDLYPADNYMLILSGHGTGIDETDGYTEGAGTGTDGAKSVIPNVSKHTEIRMPELRRVMESVTAAHPLAILAYEACYMGMFETAWQVRSANIGYILASEATMSKRIISNDQRDPSVIPGMADGSLVEPAAVARRIVADYSGNTLAAFDMRYIGSTKTLYDALAACLRAYPDIEAIRNIVAACRKANGSAIGSFPYIYEYYFDLRDFCRLLAESAIIADPVLKAAASSLYGNLAPGAGGFISAFRKKDPAENSNANGLSTLIVYDPSSVYRYTGFRDIYRRIAYYTEGNTDWDAFLARVGM
jgi:hypothetical protein